MIGADYATQAAMNVRKNRMPGIFATRASTGPRQRESGVWRYGQAYSRGRFVGRLWFWQRLLQRLGGMRRSNCRGGVRNTEASC
jgi:hypothetical protein